MFLTGYTKDIQLLRIDKLPQIMSMYKITKTQDDCVIKTFVVNLSIISNSGETNKNQQIFLSRHPVSTAFKALLAVIHTNG